MQTLFISDLHLSAEAGEIRECFFHFLETHAISAQALYILGDFFNVWVGDDNIAQWIQDIGKALKNLHEKGVAIYLMQGNRDFLLGKDWAAKYGAVLLPDPVVIELYHVPTLLTHGDSLCTADRVYQHWRQFVHWNIIQTLFLTLPLKWRQAIADKLRDKSRQYVNQLTLEKSAKMDVTSSAIESLVKKYQVKQIIHGHTHRPAVHHTEICTRFVLPDWHPKGGMLVAQPNELPQLVMF